MSILQDIKDELKKQNDLNETIAKLSQNQNAPDAEEDKRDEQNKKLSVFSKMEKTIKSINEKLIPNFLKKMGKGLIDIIKENLGMALGVLGITTLIDNWDELDGVFRSLGEAVATTLAKANEFWTRWTSGGLGNVIKNLFSENLGLLAVFAGLALMLGPIRIVIASIKAIVLVFKGLKMLFRGAKFLKGFLGRRGFLLLGAATLLTADGFMGEENPSEFDPRDNDQQPLVTSEVVNSTEESVVPSDVLDVASSERLKLSPNSTTITGTTDNTSINNTTTTDNTSINNTINEAQRVETPIAPASQEVINDYRTLQTKQENLFFDENSNIREMTPEQKLEYIQNEQKINDIRMQYPDINNNSGNLSIEFMSPEQISSIEAPNQLLQQIAYNTNVSEEIEKQRITFITQKLSEKMQIMMSSTLIENNTGIGYESGGLSTMTA